MGKLRVHNFSVSVDGFGAGPEQSLENPLGLGGLAVHQWAFATAEFQKMHGGEGGETGIDNDFIAAGNHDIGAWILGRNMFGPIRGSWPDLNWQGWWGDNPPYHVPVFVMTHYPRPPLSMAGGTTFYFVEGTPEEVLAQAQQAAQGKDVRLGGGVGTVKAFLTAQLLDYLHIVIAPVLLGSGESLWQGVNLKSLGYHVNQFTNSASVSHLEIKRSDA